MSAAASGVDVAIVGLGVVSAYGCSVRRFYEGLKAAEPVVRAIEVPGDPQRRSVCWSTVTGFAPPAWMDARILDGVDVIAQWAAAATEQALAQAAVTVDPLRTAVVHGTSMCGVQSLMRAQHALDTAGFEAVPRKVMLRALSNMAAGQLAMHYGWHGPSLTLSTACASTLDALGHGAMMIRAGRADVVVAAGTEGGHSLESGGADTTFTPALFYAPVLMGMLTADSDASRACMPFDVERRGIASSEGSAAFVLERGDRARARGARIFGYLRGYGSVADAHHPAAPDPSGEWEALAMRIALDDAAVAAGEVDALFAHATGTPKGDTAEIRAINSAYAGRARPLAVTSIKGHFGHAAAASGGMSLLAGLLGMAEGTIVNTASTTRPDPEALFDIVLGRPRSLAFDTFQVNAFGFGGQNSSIVVSRDPGRRG